MLSVLEMPSKQDTAPPTGKPITRLAFSAVDRANLANRISAALITRYRRVALSEEVEIGYFLKMARTAADPQLAEAYETCAQRLMQARDDCPLTDADRVFAQPRDARDVRIDVLETALEAVARAFALAAPESVATNLETYRQAAAKAASHSATAFSASVFGEMAARLDEAQRYAAPLPREDSDA